MWNVHYDKNLQRFFYQDTGTKAVTWTRPPDFDRDLERSLSTLVIININFVSETYIYYRLLQYLANNEIPTHEIASSLLYELNHLNKNEYLYNYFNIPSEEIESLIHDRCAFVFCGLLDEKLREQDENKRIKINSSFEAANKLIQTDKRYALVPRPSERKAIFQTWRASAPERALIMREQYFSQNLPAFMYALQQQKKFRTDMVYSKAIDLFSKEQFWTIFNDNERRRAFEEAKKIIIQEKKRKEEEIRQKNMEDLAVILVSMPEINHSTSWAAAQRLFMENESFNSNKNLLKMDKVDALDVFGNYKKSLQQDYRQQVSKEELQQSRRDRKIRDTFHHYLLDLRQRRIFGMHTKWKDFLPMVNGDPRYVDMCTQPGPTALDYFKFVQEDWREEFNRNVDDLKDVFSRANYTFNLNTTLDYLTGLIRKYDAEEKIKAHNYYYLYEKLMQEAIEKETHEKKADEASLKAFFLSEIKKADIDGNISNYDLVKTSLSAYLTNRTVLKTFQSVYDDYMLEKKEGKARKKEGSTEQKSDRHDISNSTSPHEKKHKTKKHGKHKRKHKDSESDDERKNRRDNEKRRRSDDRRDNEKHKDSERRRDDEKRKSNEKHRDSERHKDDRKYHRSRYD